MDKILRSYIGSFTIGAVQAYRNLSLFPLVSAYRGRLDYLTLDEALTLNLVTVTEVSEDGSVSQLRVTNLSQTAVLIIDGEELVGAKQNRVVNTSILIAAIAKTDIPVSCVEQGRWSYKNRLFKSEGRLLSAKIRASKAEQVKHSLKTEGLFSSDQGAIWSKIGELADCLKAKSPSMEMGAIFCKEQARLDRYTASFAALPDQVGAVFAIDGRIVGIEGFGKPETFAKAFRKLVESYALEAINAGEKNLPVEPDLAQDIAEFTRAILAGGFETRPSVGLGTDVRLESEGASGFALVHEEQLLHLSVFGRSRQ
jgi:flavodoxin